LELYKGQEAKIYNDERFTKIDMMKNARSQAFYLNFLPGQEMKSHAHPGKELYLHVLEGEGTLFVDEKNFSIEENDVIRFAPEEKVGFVNDSDQQVTIYGVMTKLL